MEMPAKKKSVHWPHDTLLTQVKLYTPETSSKVSFKNFQEVTDALLSAKFNQNAREKLLAAHKINEKGTIHNVRFVADTFGREKEWTFEVKCPGLIANVFYKCSIKPQSNGNMYRLSTEHVATVPSTGLVYSLIIGIVGGLAITWK